MIGYQDEPALKRHLQAAQALVFAADEDFGILPVEAQACGTPVIAYGRGGALETVVDEQTGLLFAEQTQEAIIDAVERFDSYCAWDAMAIRSNAKRFSAERFRQELAGLVQVEWSRFLEVQAADRSAGSGDGPDLLKIRSIRA